MADTHACSFAFSWSWAAPSVVRQDVLDFVTGLAKRCLTDDTGCGVMSAQNFFARLPNLLFENLQCERFEDGTIELRLRALFSQTADFLVAPDAEKTGSALEDVFLPLTNLSAYLHAMTAQGGGDGADQATSKTADRIDEFLLVYGGRLQNDDADIGFGRPL
ncbi:MAG: hypothetical protein AAF386_06415 [Pseudomonadota bacterium]